MHTIALQTLKDKFTSRTALVWYHWIVALGLIVNGLYYTTAMTGLSLACVLVWWVLVVCAVCGYCHVMGIKYEASGSSKSEFFIANAGDYIVFIVPTMLLLVMFSITYVPIFMAVGRGIGAESAVAAVTSRLTGEVAYVGAGQANAVVLFLPGVSTAEIFAVKQDTSTTCVVKLGDGNKVRATVSAELVLNVSAFSSTYPYFSTQQALTDAVHNVMCRQFRQVAANYLIGTMPSNLTLEQKSADSGNIAETGVRYSGTLTISDVHAYVADGGTEPWQQK